MEWDYHKISTDEFKKIQAIDERENESKAEKYREQHSVVETVEEPQNDNIEESKALFSEIRTKYKDATPQQKQDVKNVLIAHGKKKLEVSLPTEMLKEIVSKFA